MREMFWRCVSRLTISIALCVAGTPASGADVPVTAASPLSSAVVAAPPPVSSPSASSDAASSGAAANNTPAAPLPQAAEPLEQLRKDLLELNRDLFLLEEDLLFPASTQMAVFVSLDVGAFFRLDSIKLSVDGKDVSHYLYTERDLDALRRGGVHKLWLGNLTAGEHELVAIFTGMGPGERPLTRATRMQLVKAAGAKLVELRVVDDETRQQVRFDVREW